MRPAIGWSPATPFVSGLFLGFPNSVTMDFSPGQEKRMGSSKDNSWQLFKTMGCCPVIIFWCGIIQHVFKTAGEKLARL